jgi:hypothetical protein
MFRKTFIKSMLLCTVICIYSVKYGFSQQVWTRTYGGGGWDYAYALQQTADEGYIIAGWTDSFGMGYADAWIIKTDALGDTLWTKVYGGTLGDEARSVQPVSDSGFVIAGWTTSSGAGFGDAWLIKIDLSGDTLWTKTYGGTLEDVACSVQLTLDGKYIIAGNTFSYGAGDSDFWLIKTDSSGDTLWTRTYGGSDAEYANSVQETSDWGYIIAGETSSYGMGDSDIWLIKTDSSGDTLWTRTYGGIDADYACSVRQTLDEGYIIVGGTSSFGAGFYDVWLIKADSFGDTLWTKTYGGIGGDYAYTVQQTSDGGYIIAGRTSSFGAGFYDVWLIKTDIDGDTITDISKRDFEFPGNYELFQNYPNPFNPKTVIRYYLPKKTKVDLTIYNLLGKEIRKLVNHIQSAGEKSFIWEGKDNSGESVSSGIYLCQLKTAEYVNTKKLILIR